MGCGTTLIKIILFIANVLFALAGLALAGIGVVMLLGIREEKIIEPGSEAVCITAIVIGVVAFVVAFFGCCGAIMGSRMMLVIYSVLLIVLLIIKAILATLLFVALDSLTNALKDKLQFMFNHKDPVFGEIEKSLECCGTIGAVSYAPRLASASCCSATVCTSLNSFDGCLSVAEGMMRAYSILVGSLLFVVVAIELLATVSALCLANHVANKGRY